MQRRYPALQTISSLFKAFSILTIVAGLLPLVLAIAGGMGLLTMHVRYLFFGSWPVLAAAILQLFVALAVALFLWAFAELLACLVDIEYNTRLQSARSEDRPPLAAVQISKPPGVHSPSRGLESPPPHVTAVDRPAKAERDSGVSTSANLPATGAYKYTDSSVAKGGANETGTTSVADTLATSPKSEFANAKRGDSGHDARVAGARQMAGNDPAKSVSPKSPAHELDSIPKPKRPKRTFRSILHTTLW